jgi:hypothetical protein
VRSGRGDAGGCDVLKSDLKRASVQRTLSFASGFVLKTLGKNCWASQLLKMRRDLLASDWPKRDNSTFSFSFSFSSGGAERVELFLIDA